jgi:hypothetical protein
MQASSSREVLIVVAMQVLTQSMVGSLRQNEITIATAGFVEK